MENDKIIQRAIAKTIVWDTSDVIKLVNKYDPVKKNISYKNLFLKVQDNIDKPKFSEELTKLLLKKKRLSDFNNTGTNKATKQNAKMRNAIGGVIVTSLTQLTNGIVSAVSAGKDRELEEDKLDARNTAQIMSFMQSEDEERMAKEKQTNMIIMVAVGGMIFITGLMIFKAK